MTSPFSEDWTARDVVALGFTMDDLLNHAGMEYQEQYFDLQPTTEDEVALKVQPSHASRLRSLEVVMLSKDVPQREDPFQQEREVYIPKRDPHFAGDDDNNPYQVPRRTRHGLKPKKK